MSNNLQKNSNKNLGECITLDKAEINVRYVIASCDLPQPLKNRFAEMGIVEGEEVSVIKSAPLKDPLEIKVMDYSLCVRARELRLIKVKKVDNE